jgi:DNA-binding phage protein
MSIKTKPFDPVDYLETEEAIAEFMAVGTETGDPEFIANARTVVMRAKTAQSAKSGKSES